MSGKRKENKPYRRRRRNGEKEEEKVEKEDRELTFQNIYFNPADPASFGSPLKLFNAAQKKHPELKIEEVRAWLSKQKAYTLHREIKLHFPRRKVIVSGKGIQYQADLMDVSNIKSYNDGNTFLLTVIDCFSRFATAVPLKSKSGAVVLNGLRQAFTEMGPRPPVNLQTDEGTEFKAAVVQKWLYDNGTHWFHSFQNVKAQIVERFNRTLRNKLQKYSEYSSSLRYIEVLPALLKGYNSAVHSALKRFSPNQVTEKNSREIFEIQYGKYLNAKKKLHKFKVNDVVRISEYRSTFFKKTTAQNFTSELFVISDVLPNLNPPTYRVKSFSDNEAISGIFYESELQPVILE